jgi:hypothetical protein
MRNGTELRRHQRTRLRANIRAGWEDGSGRQKFCNTQSLDISISGLRLELPENIEARSMVNVKSEQLQLHSSGTVRHCRRTGVQYTVGIEFNGGFRWRPMLLEGLRTDPVLVEILVSPPK